MEESTASVIYKAESARKKYDFAFISWMVAYEEWRYNPNAETRAEVRRTKKLRDVEYKIYLAWAERSLTAQANDHREATKKGIPWNVRTIAR